MVACKLALLDKEDVKSKHVFRLESFRSGNVKKAPLLMGSNDNEGYYFMLYGLGDYFNIENTGTLNRDEYLRAINSKIHAEEKKSLKEEIAFFYEATKGDRRYREVLDDMEGDFEFVCPTMHHAERAAQLGNDVYVYHFKQRSSENTWPEWMGVLHGYEIEYVFGVPLQADKIKYTADEKELSRKMLAFWANFAKEGDPNKNADGSTTSDTWPLYTAGKGASSDLQYLVLNGGATLEAARARRYPQCQFWNKFVPNLKRNLQKGAFCSSTASVMRAGSKFGFIPFALLTPFIERCL